MSLLKIDYLTSFLISVGPSGSSLVVPKSKWTVTASTTDTQAQNIIDGYYSHYYQSENKPNTLAWNWLMVDFKEFIRVTADLF